jgi:cation:H+ antiporter
MLGLLAALAADTPEISSAISALAHHQKEVGIGVVLGSNVFNLAALLGLGAIVAGRIRLHRRVVVLEGTIGAWVAIVVLLTVLHIATPPVALALVLAVLVPYVIFAGLSASERRRRFATSRFQRWLGSALAEEETELLEAIHPRPGRTADIVTASVALIVVVLASIAMERAASTLGKRLSVPDILVGTLVLAAVTSLPNAVAAIYLARRGRGAASLSTAFNSNAVNALAGFILPATVIGIGAASGDVTLVAGWYLGLTLLVVLFAYFERGLRRLAGVTIVAGYAVFVVNLTIAASR